VRCSRGAEPEHENGSRFGSQASLSSQRTRFLGVASSAVLTASEALAQAIATPTTPTTPPADSPKSGTERRQDSEVAERNAVRNDAQDAQSGVRSGARGETNDGTRAMAPPPPAPRSNRSPGSTRQRSASGRAARNAVQRAASAGPADSGQAPIVSRVKNDVSSSCAGAFRGGRAGRQCVRRLAVAPAVSVIVSAPARRCPEGGRQVRPFSLVGGDGKRFDHNMQ
jgi:hypothetical protein